MVNLNLPGSDFPDPIDASGDGPLAYGGDLGSQRLLKAYSAGIFPWYNPGEEILWWSPDPRFVLLPGELAISKSMKKVLEREVFRFTQNQCFREVMLSCAQPRRDGGGTWISEELIDAYLSLHHLGAAHSFEAWQGNELVGGFYGVSVGKVFCGESMFSKVGNASKAVFINFVSKQQDYSLIDCQVYSGHLASLGARLVPRKVFLEILQNR